MSNYTSCLSNDGELAQLGERFAGSEEVVGSIPIFSTISVYPTIISLSKNNSLPFVFIFTILLYMFKY